MNGDMRPSPILSVILPVYNAKQFVEQAIASVLQQSFSNFELIIVDDGSIDGTTDILKRLAVQDDRVVLIVRENHGLVASLNEGIGIARGKFIARMDADDIALPHRFARQIDFLNSSGCDLCGTAVQCFGNSQHVWYYPETPDEVEVQLLFDSPYAHPTVMCRAVVYKTLSYHRDFTYAEDYDLWQRAWRLGFKGGNLKEVLLLYRVHDSQVSNARKVQQRLLADSIRQRHWQIMAGHAYEVEIHRLLELFRGERGNFTNIQPLLRDVLQKYRGPAQLRFANQTFRICARAAASSQRPWLVWRDLLECSETGRNVKQELVLFAIWALGLKPDGSLYSKAKNWYLGRQQY
jgi:glycosyltransferase involved in cell wall biosynthesis